MSLGAFGFSARRALKIGVHRRCKIDHGQRCGFTLYDMGHHHDPFLMEFQTVMVIRI